MQEETSRGDITRQKIIEAAYQLFTSQGYHGTSMRQIAQHAAIAPASIYNHFASKEEIYTAVIIAKHPITTVLPAVEHIQGDEIETIARQTGHAFIANLEAQEGLINLALVEIVEFKGQHLPVLVASIYPRALAFAQRVKTRGSNLRDVPTPAIMVAFISLIFAYFAFSRLFSLLPSKQRPELDLDTMLDVLLYGLVQRSAEE